MIKNVLLINSSNGHSTPPRLYPYGLAILSGLLKKCGIETTCFDGNIVGESDLEKVLKDKKFDIAGISGMITSFEYQRKISEIIKQNSPGTTVITGGGLVTSLGRQLLELIPNIDIGFMGEAESTLKEFIQRCNRKDYDGSIPNVITLEKKGTEAVKKNDLPDLNKIPLPDFEGWQIRKYLENPPFPTTPALANSKRRASTLISRGCPYACDYCSNTSERKRIRFRSIENVFEEISILTGKYGVDYIFFNDETFLINNKFFRDFLEFYHKGNHKFKWSTSTRSNLVDSEKLSELVRANCDFVYYGFESGSQKILDAMNKRTTVEQNFEAFVKTAEAGLYCKPNLIIGYDNETLETAEETFNFLRKLEEFGKKIRDSFQRAIFERNINNIGKVYIATPYPGTAFFERTKNRIPYSLKDVLQKISFNDAVNLTVNVSCIPDDELKSIRDELTKYVINLRL